MSKEIPDRIFEVQPGTRDPGPGTRDTGLNTTPLIPQQKIDRETDLDILENGSKL